MKVTIIKTILITICITNIAICLIGLNDATITFAIFGISNFLMGIKIAIAKRFPIKIVE